MQRQLLNFLPYWFEAGRFSGLVLETGHPAEEKQLT